MTEAILELMWRGTFFLADLGLPAPGIAPPTQVAPGVAPGTGVAPVAPTPVQPEPVGMPWFVFVLWGGVIVVFYLIFMRPQRKREKQRKEMQAAITTGDNVVTNSGLFGKVTAIGDDCFIVEFGTDRGIRIPILKSEVAGVRSPNMTPPPKPVD